MHEGREKEAAIAVESVSELHWTHLGLSDIATDLPKTYLPFSYFSFENVLASK